MPHSDASQTTTYRGWLSFPTATAWTGGCALCLTVTWDLVDQGTACYITCVGGVSRPALPTAVGAAEAFRLTLDTGLPFSIAVLGLRFEWWLLA